MIGQTNEEYMERVGPHGAAAMLRFLIKRDCRSKIPDPSAKRRKNPTLAGDELTLFEFAVESFREKSMEHYSYVAIMIRDAFQKNDKRTFEIIAMASDYVKEPYQTKHGKNVLATMEAAAEIMEKEDRFPTKDELKQRVNVMLGLDAYGAKDNQDWTKVFGTAQLKFLKAKPPKRGLTGHGGG
jgi:hypothetical protein